jgi:hypothetical protein
VRLEELSKLKKSNNLIGNRTRDLSACNTAPPPKKTEFQKPDTHKNLLVPKMFGIKYLKTQLNRVSAWFHLPKCVPVLKRIHDKDAIFVDTKILISQSFNKNVKTKVTDWLS